MHKQALLLGASVLALSSLAAAAPQASRPSPAPAAPAAPPADLRKPNACEATGATVFIVKRRSAATPGSAGTAEPQTVTTLYATGAVSQIVIGVDGKSAPATNGCLGDTSLEKVRRQLAKADWTVHRAQAACAAISNTWVEYWMNDKALFSQKMCQLEYLDDASMKLLAALTKQLDDATKPVTPPCCKR